MSLARLGGDEFTILLEEIRDCGDAIRVAERLQERLAVPFVVEGQEVVITASIGIAFCATSYTNSEELIRDAEIAMYRAKREGKARSQVFDADDAHRLRSRDCGSKQTFAEHWNWANSEFTINLFYRSKREDYRIRGTQQMATA